ncbi:MAG: hypothetical protein PHX62_03135 [Bacilli bacterium]|nr:hypothetical protein [Bacilli bacterium]
MVLQEICDQIVIRGGWNTTYTVTEGNLNLLANKAHIFCAGYKKWAFTEGRVATTFASLVTTEDGYLAGEYPEGWKSDSIKLLKIDGKQVDKKEFYKFTKFLEDNSGSTERFYSDFSRRYYINPNIDLSGTVTVWGQYTPASMTAETYTIFNGDTDGEEAIITMGMSYVYRRLGDEQNANIYEKTARTILEELYSRIQAEQYQYQSPPDDGMFKRFDVIEGGFADDLNTNQF